MAGPIQRSSPGAVPPAQVDAVMGAARVLVAVVAASVAEVEDRVTLPQLRVLVLAGARGSLTLGGVAGALGVHPSNATRTCDRLVAAGLVDRRDDPADRRQLRLTLTRGGQGMVDTVLRHRRSAVEQAMAGMSAASRGQLAAGLAAFAAAAGTIDDDASSALGWGA